MTNIDESIIRSVLNCSPVVFSLRLYVTQFVQPSLLINWPWGLPENKKKILGPNPNSQKSYSD